jgi:DNA-binding NarL/FixJ family response regulator
VILNSPSSSLLSIRNCCRCGDEFRVNGNATVCPACRKPRNARSPEPGTHLTPREKQIVFLVSQAKLNKEIAYLLHLSEGTIKEYLNKIFRKLDVRNRTELAIWWLNNPAACGPAPAPLENTYVPAG